MDEAAFSAHCAAELEAMIMAEGADTIAAFIMKIFSQVFKRFVHGRGTCRFHTDDFSIRAKPRWSLEDLPPL